MKEQVRKQLEQLAEPEYALFQKKLLPGVENIMGVRLPALRKIAKEIAKNNGAMYLKNAEEEFFEEIMLQGLIIGYLKEDISVIIELILDFVPKITNWSVCDSFCVSLKIVKKHPEEMWKCIQVYLQSKEEYELRFAIVMILLYFLEEEYIERVLDRLDKISSEKYYVRMAAAWAISMAYVKFEKKIENYLLNKNGLDDFTYYKAIQKIIESNQVTAEKKIYWRKLKKDGHILGGHLY